MSFIDEIKNELQKDLPIESAAAAPSLQEDRFKEFLKEETQALQQEIRTSVRTGNYKRIGEKHVFEGTRLWHEGDYSRGTDSLATFYSFLARDTILDREILDQRKKLIKGFSYEVRYTLTKEGAAYFELFTKEMGKEGIQINGLFVLEDNGQTDNLPYTDRGDVKYDFELEHHLSDYPKLCYTYRMEI